MSLHCNIRCLDLILYLRVVFAWMRRKLHLWQQKIKNIINRLIFERNLLDDVKLNLRISNWCGGLPFKWNENLDQLENKSGKQLYIHRIRLGIATLYFTFTLIQSLRVFKQASLMVITHSILFHSCAFMAISCLFVNNVQLSAVVQLCNGFIQHQQSFTNGFGFTKAQSNSSNLYLRGMIYLLTWTGISIPIFHHLDIFRNPCFPSYLGYWMSTQCEYGRPGYFLKPTWTPMEILTKAGISMASYLSWSFLLAGCNFLMSLEYVMEGNCLRVCIEEFGKKLSRIDRDHFSDFPKLTVFHRQIQIMSIHYRLNFSQLQIGCAIPCFIAMQTACLYNTISLLSGKGSGPIWFKLLYVWSEVVTFYLIIFVFGILADVHNVSNRVHRKINGNTAVKRNKWFQRWIKSCPVIKIYFGGSNFLDRLTPLNMLDFAINQTANLMLLQTK